MSLQTHQLIQIRVNKKTRDIKDQAKKDDIYIYIHTLFTVSP